MLRLTSCLAPSKFLCSNGNGICLHDRSFPRRLTVATTVKPRISACKMAALESTEFADVDVLIIGAGFAGIAAARQLQSASSPVSFQVLEATSRPGGRAGKTIQVASQPVELGANWIHGQQGNVIFDLARERDLIDTDAENSEDRRLGSSKVLMEGGVEMDEKTFQEALAFWQDLWEHQVCTYRSADYPQGGTATSSGDHYSRYQDTCAAFLDIKCAAWQAARGYSDAAQRAFEWRARLERSISAAPLGELGLRGIGHYEEYEGSQFTRLRQGYKSLVDSLVGDLPPGSILYNTRVTRVQWVGEDGEDGDGKGMDGAAGASHEGGGAGGSRHGSNSRIRGHGGMGKGASTSTGDGDVCQQRGTKGRARSCGRCAGGFLVEACVGGAGSGLDEGRLGVSTSTDTYCGSEHGSRDDISSNHDDLSSGHAEGGSSDHPGAQGSGGARRGSSGGSRKGEDVATGGSTSQGRPSLRGISSTQPPRSGGDAVRAAQPTRVLYRARTVLFTASLGVLKHEHGRLFSPPLPAWKVDAIERAGFGVVEKVFLDWGEEGCPPEVPDNIYFMHAPAHARAEEAPGAPSLYDQLFSCFR
eukprot:jgi/Mesvir1/6062/Mv00793-RA.2